MRKQFAIFCARWLVNSVALWVAVRLLETGDYATTPDSIVTFLFAGLALSLVNTLLRPIVIILSLPAIVLTIGLFMLVVNGFLVFIAIQLVPGLSLTFMSSIVAGIVVSLANYVFSGIMDQYKGTKEL